MIIIQAKQKQGLWRCGVFHSFEAIQHEDDAFTDEQLAVLQAEPLLSVQVLGEAEDGTGDAKTKRGKKTDTE